MDYKQFIVDCGIRMLESGLTVETWGNISARDPETGLIYLTPSGMNYRTITRDDIVVMNSNMEVVEGSRKPTIEYPLHVGIMNMRPEINAVVHTHPVYSQVFGMLHMDIPPVIDEAAQAFGGTVKCADYAIPGTPELAENVLKAIGEKGMACLMANHGAVCIGETMDIAFKGCTVLEMTARIYQMGLAIGKVEPLSKEIVDVTRDFALNKYGQK